MKSADDRNIGRNRSPLARVVFASDGEIRTARLVGIVALGLGILGAGTFAGLIAAGAGSPLALGIWVLIGVIAIKLPILGLVWYLLGRGGESTVAPSWSDQETRGILDYLARESAAAAARPDALTRLEYFAREAWFVADSAPEEHRPEAVDLAVRIEGMASRARARTGRTSLAGEAGVPAPPAPPARR